MQTKRGSLIETISNIVIGLWVSLILNAILFPLLGFNLSHKQNITLTLIYTVVSIVRSYSLRRLFNWVSIKYKI